MLPFIVIGNEPSEPSMLQCINNDFYVYYFSAPSQYCFMQIEVLFISVVFLFHRKVNRILFISLTIYSLEFGSVIKI